MNHRVLACAGSLGLFNGKPDASANSACQRRLRLVVKRTILFVAFCVFCGHLNAENLLPDSSFTTVNEFSNQSEIKGWHWQRIEEPCEVRSHKNQTTLQGGKVFLHSVEFPVESGTNYDLQIEASGDAKFAGEILWWKKNGLLASSHRSVVIKPSRLTAKGTKFEARIRAPSDAATAYVRFVAESGKAVLKSPLLRVASGELLLKLDAAAPGSSPNERWKDLAERNQDFELQSVTHSQKANSYVFNQPGASCVSTMKDASRFDFETDLAAGTGRGASFTVVLYAKLSGRSGSGIVNKIADPTKGGWSIGLEWDQFNLDRISTLQQSNNQQHRTINGFPGLAGHGGDIKLGATDGKFHLYVVHLTGSGQRDGKVYFDGNEKPLLITAWPFGRLSSGPVRNDAPLRIGSFNKKGFRGEIGFVEIWSGSRLNRGMTPAEYSKHRYNKGAPLRAK
ncbi:MAG: hypothetical protein CMJ78_07510 [Planctomycetaceae bacterium]|nr:hypothetical protein [Planctomycetaceae bacterium]